MAGESVTNRRYCGVQRNPRLLGDNYVAYFRTIHLGYFVTPEEAALAHNHAALLLDGSESPPNAIPPDRIPNQERQKAIKAGVEKCVGHANGLATVIRPRPLSPNCASGYMAVSAARPPGKWETGITLHGHRVLLGYYESKHEAAYAYNYAVELLGDQNAPTNVIPIAFLPLPERRLEIHGLVEHHLHELGVFAPKAASQDRAIKISGVSKNSGYRGVQSLNKGSRWMAYLVRNYNNVDLGHYASKHEAALAFNHAVHILRADHIPLNLVLATDLPALEDHALIKLLVEQRLWKHDLIEQQPPHGDYAEYLFRYLNRQGYLGVRFHSASKLWRVAVPYQGKTIAVGYFKTEHEGAFAFEHAAQVLGLPDWLKNRIANEHIPDRTAQQRIQAKVESKLLIRKTTPPLMPLPKQNDPDARPDVQAPLTTLVQDRTATDTSLGNHQTDPIRIDELFPLATAPH